MVDWQLEAMYAVRVVVAAFLGGMVGWEREWHGREAGIRTYSSVALGSCVFALISSHIPNAEPSRFDANIVTGVGFLGAGIILLNRGRTVGLTTAAAVGTALGFGCTSWPCLRRYWSRPIRHFAIAISVNTEGLWLTRAAGPFPIGFRSYLPGTPSSGLQLLGNTVARTKVLLVRRLPSECRVWEKELCSCT